MEFLQKVDVCEVKQGLHCAVKCSILDPVKPCLGYFILFCYLGAGKAPKPFADDQVLANHVGLRCDS